MSDVDRWMHRGAERQRLLEALMREVYATEEEIVDSKDPPAPPKARIKEMVAYRFLMQLLPQLMIRMPGTQVPFEFNTLIAGKSAELLGEIEKFARVREESTALLVDFIERLVSTLHLTVQHALNEREMHDPESVFGRPPTDTE